MNDLIHPPPRIAGTLPGELRIQVFDTADSIRDLWQAFEATACGYGFQTHAWIATLLDTVDRDRPQRPAIVLVTDAAGAPGLLLPLTIRRTGGLNRLEFIDSGFADYNAPLITADLAQALAGGGFPALWRRILAAVGPVDMVRLTKLPEHIGPVSNPFLQLPCRPSGISFQVPLAGDFESFLRSRSANLRQDSRAKRRRLARRHGPVALHIAATGEEIDRLLDVLVRQKSQRYRATGAVNRFRAPATAAFYRAIAHREAASGRVQVAALTAGDHVVAAHLGLVVGDRFYWLMPAFDTETFASFSPGRLLLVELLAWAFEHGLAVFDLTIGDEPYKRDWADQTMPLYTHLGGVTPAGRLQTGGERLYRSVKAEVQARYPGLFATLKSWRRSLPGR